MHVVYFSTYIIHKSGSNTQHIIFVPSKIVTRRNPYSIYVCVQCGHLPLQ